MGLLCHRCSRPSLCRLCRLGRLGRGERRCAPVPPRTRRRAGP
ncbi:hypothetical protein SGM_4315 [Streptomyces griseoaurantiacus M045]|uniref:Uncharacterized protein n=1 Tax=Streptomyces griseoaurantiacus M045 TaxID=996637 RepID=F3NM60_9ACTN|nr:hypothetical protein SGM_4315 [Streptomyces griseoaurantiacus M045]